MLFDRESEKKKWKLSDGEFDSLPASIQIYAETGSGQLPTGWMTDWRKKNPAQKTKADSTFRTLADGREVGFDKKKDAYQLRQYDISNAKRIADAQDKLAKKGKPKTDGENVQRISKEVSELSSTAKRLQDVGADDSGIQGVITTKIDSLNMYTDKINKIEQEKKTKSKVEAIRKLPKEDIQDIRSHVNQLLRVAVMSKKEENIQKVAEVFHNKFGITIEELVQLAK